jgi:hypothetical protein
MEAAACRCKILSIPLGVAGDILEAESFFGTPSEGAEILARDIRSGGLDRTVAPQLLRWQTSHTTGTLKKCLRDLYGSLGGRPAFQLKKRMRPPNVCVAAGKQFGHELRRRLGKRRLPSRIYWNHTEGTNAALDLVMRCVRALLEAWGVDVSSDFSAPVELVGHGRTQGRSPSIQFLVPGMKPEGLPEKTVLVAPSVQDVLNLRSGGFRQTAIVIPFPNSFPVEPGEDLLVVGEGDMFASLRVWGALAAGRPVVYPKESAYFEQVFHAGAGFGGTCDRAAALETASQDRSRLTEFIRIPTDKESATALKTLLMAQYGGV